MDPNPIKHPVVLLARIRDEIEPSLIAAGFQFDGRNKPPRHCGDSLWIDYVRDGDTFSICFVRFQGFPKIAAEVLDNHGRIQVVAEVHLNDLRTHDELLKSVSPFITRIKSFLKPSIDQPCHDDSTLTSPHS